MPLELPGSLDWSYLEAVDWRQVTVCLCYSNLFVTGLKDSRGSVKAGTAVSFARVGMNSVTMAVNCLVAKNSVVKNLVASMQEERVMTVGAFVVIHRILVPARPHKYSQVVPDV